VMEGSRPWFAAGPDDNDEGQTEFRARREP